MKLYVREDGTERMLRLVDDSAIDQFALLALAQAEFRSAIRRRERAGDMGESVAAEVLERFEVHLATMYVRQGMSDAVIDLACAVIDRYPLKAYDALQLAGCLVVKSAAPSPPIFVCSDHQLIQAAKTEGLAWLDPTE